MFQDTFSCGYDILKLLYKLITEFLLAKVIFGEVCTSQVQLISSQERRRFKRLCPEVFFEGHIIFTRTSRRQGPSEKSPPVMKTKKTIRPEPANVFQKIEIKQPLGGDEAKAISALRSLLQKKRKVVVISGAGMSVNAGSEPLSLFSGFQMFPLFTQPSFQCDHSILRGSYPAVVGDVP